MSLCAIPDERAAITEMYRVLREGGWLVLLDHVASDRRAILVGRRLLEKVTPRRFGDYLPGRPLPIVADGFAIECSRRSKADIVERLTAVKPAVT